MEIDPRVTQTPFEVKGMSDDLKAQIMALDAKFYPDTVTCTYALDEDSLDADAMEGQTNTVDVNVADFFSLRHSDRLSMGATFAPAKGISVKTIVSSGYDDTPVRIAGAHLSHNYQEAKAAETDNKESAQDSKRKRDNKPQQPQPPLNTDTYVQQTVMIALCLDTQMPHIKVSVNYVGKRVMSTCIYAQEIQHKDDGLVDMQATVWKPYDKSVDKEQYPEPMHTYMMLASLSKVQAFTLHLRLVASDKPRVWSGVSEHEMKQLRASIDLNQARDSLVSFLDDTTSSGGKVYFGISTPTPKLKRWEEFVTNAQRLFTVAKHRGNLWWYRLQCELRGQSQDAIDEADLPHFTILEPRWMATEYIFTTTTTADGKLTHSDPKISKWQPFFMERVYPNANEASFLLKLAVIEERKHQLSKINKLLQSSDDLSWFRARLSPVDDPPGGRRFVVEVNYGLATARIGELDVKLPGPGTRIRFAMNRDGSSSHDEQSVQFSAVVVNNIEDNECAFVCVAEIIIGKLTIKDFGGEYPISLGYVIDSVPFERQLAAIKQLQIRTEFKNGPDVRSIVFGCAPVASNPTKLSASVKPEQIAVVESIIEEASLNEGQAKAVLHTFSSQSGLTVISAPFGTGKTKTEAVCADAHLRVGHRVLSIAPSNAAVRTQVDHFIRHNNSLPLEFQLADEQWCFFTGGHWKVKNAANLQMEQMQQVQREEADNDAADFYRLRDELSQERPSYRWTFGHKLSNQIEFWASLEISTVGKIRGPDPSGTCRYAKDFLELKNNMRNIPYGDERKNAQTAHRNLEYNLARYFMKHYVNQVFCTINTAAHELVIEGGPWHNCNCDEAGQETLPGLAVVLGAHVNTVWQWTFAGDPKQLEGVLLSKGRNVGYRMAARSIFRELTEEVERYDDAQDSRGKDVIMLTDCFRMPESLLEWPNKNVYDGKLVPDPSTLFLEQPLQASLKVYWSSRIRKELANNSSMLCIDQTGADIVSGFVGTSTTRTNQHEAHVVAWIVKDMVTWNPPNNGRRILGSDILILTPYVGMVTEIRRMLNKKFDGQRDPSSSDLRAIRVMSTFSSQGKEGNIVLMCFTVAPGISNPGRNDKIPISYLAGINHFNTMLTRCRIARYIIGAFGTFEMARKIKHSATLGKNKKFFEFIDLAARTDTVMSRSELHHLMTTNRMPTAEDRLMPFHQTLSDGYAFSGSMPDRVAPEESASLFHDMGEGKHITHTMNSQKQTAAPPVVASSDHRDEDGNLLRADGDAKKKKKKQKRGGVKHKKKRDDVLPPAPPSK
jgi:hypothetical protein